MKKIYYLLFIATVFIGSCKKEDAAEAQGTLTAKIDIYDPVTKKWSGGKDFTATSVVTVKTGNDYAITAKDASNTTFTLVIKNVTGAGKYTTVNSTLVQSGTTLTATAGQADITTATSSSVAGTFIFENANWSVFNGKVDARF